MSGQLTVRFAPDMPPASVEIVSPDLATVSQIRLAPGTSEQVDVPSEGSFLRVHLPSGRVVTLRGDYSLDRTVHLTDLERSDRPRQPTGTPSRTGTTRDEVRRYLTGRSVGVAADYDTTGELTDSPTLAGLGTVVLKTRSGTLLRGQSSSDLSEIAFESIAESQRMLLTVAMPDRELQVQVPGNATRVLVRVDNVRSSSHGHDLHLAVQIATRNADADAVTAYLARGDLQAAESMASWADPAQNLLYEKFEDPFAASVGGYLLLRLRRFDLMRDWARNLADWFPDLSDGAIIWAWQRIFQHGPSAGSEIESYLKLAAARDLPIYSEGLRLLSDGLRMLPPDVGQPLIEQLNLRAGSGVWSSPFTAGLFDRREKPDRGPRVETDIAIAPRA